jgi:hypothetical protein
VLLAIDYLAIGRSGEAGLQSLSNCHWDEGNQFLVINWPQIQTAQPKLLTMHQDSQEPFMNFYFLYACHQASGGIPSGEDSQKWVLWEIASSYRPANDLLEALHENLGTVGGPLKEHDGTSIRRGAINKLLMDCYNVTLPMLVMRSGHGLTRVCAVFEYERMALLYSSIAGKSLGDWPNPQKLLPSIKLAPVENHAFKTEGGKGINRLMNLLGAVFEVNSHNNLLRHGGRLFNFVKCCFATPLLHLI